MATRAPAHMTRRDRQLAAGLATAMLAGEWHFEALERGILATLGKRRSSAWMRELAVDVLEAYRDPPRDRPGELARFLPTQPSWEKGRRSRGYRSLRIVHWHPVPTAIIRRPWPVADLPDLGALAALLDLDSGELAWFADTRSWARHADSPLRHYRWWTVPKRDGVRLLAAPKPRLKEIQRRLLRHVLAPIPLHAAAHGSVPGRSVRTAVAPHTGATVVIRADLEGFFASISAPRIWGLLRTAGLPEPVAVAITGLSTTVVPLSVWRAVPVARDVYAHERMGERLRAPHLPQGAPTSPALANALAYRLDRRLAGLAERFDARYTRYVDDLTFSGGPGLRAGRGGFLDAVGKIAESEGFRLAERKSVVLGDAGRQQVLGAVVNHHPTISRPERDNLRALLHNCVVHGGRSQARGQADFRSALAGRIGAVQALDPALGARLRARFDEIDWS